MSSSSAVTARLAVGEFLCNKPSLNSVSSNSTDDILFNRLSDILVIPVGFLHIPEHIYLIFYLYKFLVDYYSNSWEEGYKKAVKKKMTKFVSSKCGRSSFYAIIMTIFMVTGIALPPICIARTYLDTGSSSEHCSQRLSTITRILTHFFHFSSMFTNIIIVLVRLLMVYFTVMVGVLWREVKPIPDDEENRPVIPGEEKKPEATANTSNEESPGQDSDPGQMNGSQGQAVMAKPENSQLVSDIFMKVCQKHTEYLIEYELIVEKTRKIYNIFQSFFVLQWIIHLFQLFVHIAHLLRPWIRYGQVQNANMLIITQQIDQLSYAVFNGLALVITHVCGLKMNAYMRRYLREVQYHRSECLLKESKDTSGESANKENPSKSLKARLKGAKGKYKKEDCLEYSLINLVPIREECIYLSAFTPRIPGTGLGISITNPAFVISIVLTVFALIGAMIAF